MKEMPKKYSCKWLGYEITGIAARNCNYCNFETFMCRHSGESCVAKEGLEQFAQSLDKSTFKLLNEEQYGQLDFFQILFEQQTEDIQEQSKPKLTRDYFLQEAVKQEEVKRHEIYKQIAKMWTDKYGDD